MNANRPKAAESWLEDHDVGRPEVKLGRPLRFDEFSGAIFFFRGYIYIPTGKVTSSWLEKNTIFNTEIHRLIHGVFSQPAMLSQPKG